jgi:hypothetical protein
MSLISNQPSKQSNVTLAPQLSQAPALMVGKKNGRRNGEKMEEEGSKLSS